MEAPQHKSQKRLVIVASVVLTLLVLVGLALYTQLSALTYATLVDRLRAEGATVMPNGTVQQPFFSVPGRILGVDGEDVQVFEYATPLSAYAEAAQVAPDGKAIGRFVDINWIATPHFYKRGRVIAIYIGENPALTRLLSKILGLQFAGG